MADSAPARSNFGTRAPGGQMQGGRPGGPGGPGGRPGGPGGRPGGPGGRPGGPGGRGPRGVKEEKEWEPVTKIGRLVKGGKISSLEDLYKHSISIKEAEIIDHFLGPELKDEVLKIMPVQKQTRSGQRTRFKAFVAIGDSNGHVGLGVKCSKEVATAIRGAIIAAKLSIVPVRRGYWGNKIGKPHTIPCKVSIFIRPLASLRLLTLASGDDWLFRSFDLVRALYALFSQFVVLEPEHRDRFLHRTLMQCDKASALSWPQVGWKQRR